MALVNTLAIRLELITAGIKAGFYQVAGPINKVAGQFDKLNNKFDETKQKATEVAQNIAGIGAGGAGVQGLIELGNVSDEILEKTRALEDSIREFAGSLEQELADLAGEAAPAAKGIFKLGEEAAALGPKGIPVIDKIIAKLEELNSIPGKSAGAFNVTIDAVKRLRTEAEAVGKPVSILTRFTQAFIGTVQKGQTPLSAFIEKNKTLGSVFSNLKTFVAGLNPVMAGFVAVLGLVGGGIISAVRNVIALGEELSAASRRTGFTVEALSQLKFVAEQNQSSFEELLTGLRNYNRNIGETLSGNNDAREAFEALGVSLNDLKTLSQEDILDKVSLGLENTASAALRTSRGLDIFGRGSERIVDVFSRGPAAIAEFRKEADQLGGTFTTKLALAAEELTNNFGKLRTLQQGLAIAIATQVVPAINGLLVSVIPLIQSALPGLIGFIQDTAFEFTKLAAAMEVMAAAAQIIDAALDRDEDAFDKASAAMDEAFKKLGQTREEFLAAQKAAAGLVPILNDNSGAAGKLKDQLSELAEQLQRTFAEIAGEADPRAQELVDLAKQFASLGPKGKKGIQEIIAEFERLNQIPSKTAGQFTTTIQKLREIAAQATPVRGLTFEISKISEQLEGGADAATSAAVALLEIGTPKTIQQFNTLLGKLIEIGNAGDEAAQKVARALTPLEGPQIDPAELERRRLAGFQGPSTDAAERAADPFAVGAPIDADVLEQRQEDLRRQQFDVGPEVPENLERVSDIFGEIILLTEEAKIGFAALDTLAGGFGSALADVFSAKNKKAFIDFFKSLRDQIIAAIAKALILRTILSILPGGGIFGGLGKLLTGKPFETPSLDAFAQSEGSRFGLLFGRGLRSTLGQTAFAGIGANLGTSNVVIEPQIVVQNAGPLARVEWFDRGQEQRLRRRQEELGGAPL